MANDIQVSKNTIEQISSSVFKQMSEIFKKDYSEQQKYIIKISKQYIKEIEKSQESFNKLLEYQNQYRKAIMVQQQQYNTNTWKKIEKSQSAKIRNYIRRELDIDSKMLNNFFIASMKYNEQILTFLNKKQQFTTIIVDDANGHPVVIRTTYQDYFKDKGLSINRQGHSLKDIVGRFQINVNKCLLELENNIVKQSTLGKNSLRGLNQTYQSSITTFNRFKGWIFWRRYNQSQWYKMKPAGKLGDIRQAYGYFFFNIPKAKEDTLFLSHLYNNLDYFYRNGVALIDNISGNIRPDLSSGDSIKSLRAQLPSLQQLKTIAYGICEQQPDQINEDFIRRLILSQGQLENLKNNVETGLRNHVQKATVRDIRKAYRIAFKI